MKIYRPFAADSYTEIGELVHPPQQDKILKMRRQIDTSLSLADDRHVGCWGQPGRDTWLKLTNLSVNHPS